MNPSIDHQTTYTRREFNSLFLMLVSLFTAASTARAGIDEPAKRGRGKKRSGKDAALEEIEGCHLFIDLPPGESWSLDWNLGDEECRQIRINPLDVSPRLAAQLAAAKASEKDPVLIRVLGDPVAVLLQACYFGPGEEIFWSEEHPKDAWRIEYFGDGIRRIKPDDSSWWQHRLKPIEGHPDWNAHERAFAEIWEKQNKEQWSYNGGLIQALMLSTYEHEKPRGFEPWITNRERKICATMIQWLGTNCGRSFLYEVRTRAKQDTTSELV